MSIILITGATSGFGEASAHLFAENGWNIIISGRRKERLEKLETVLKSTYKVEVLSLCFDVRNVEEVKTVISSLQDNWKNVDVLLNMLV
jgi:NADP-dependent 3-hydroxy acid dehydrogenase YdfG